MNSQKIRTERARVCREEWTNVFIDYFRGLPSTGPIIVMMFLMISMDLRIFSIIYSVCLAGFTLGIRDSCGVNV